MKKEKLVVIDGHALIHRAYHAIPNLTTKNGEPVNAVYGFSVILLKVISDLKPQYITVAMDLPNKTFRHQEYAGYKANRPTAPGDLVSQFYLVREVIEALNIPIYEKPGYEADDIIGTLSKKAKKEKDLETYIVTGDLDELQLVDSTTKVYTMKRGFTDTVIYDEEAVYNRYGLIPAEFVDFKALKGDPSDNIPGVSGIGEKTAIELIERYHNLDKLYQNLSEVKPRVAEKLEKDRDLAYLSKKLSQIVTDLPLEFRLTKCQTGDFDRAKVLELFRRLEFKSLISKLPEPEKKLRDNLSGETEAKIQNTKVETKYHLINTLELLKELRKKLLTAEIIAIDTETDSLDPITAKLVGISFSIKEGEGYYLPVGHKNGLQLDLETIKKELGVIVDGGPGKVGHNIKFDYQVLYNAGLWIRPIVFDTMIAAYLINPSSRAQKLSDLSFSELGVEMTEITTLIGSKKEQITFDLVDIVKATEYAAEDADMTLRLYRLLRKDIDKNGQSELLEKIELPLIPILANIELTGVRIDENILTSLSSQFTKKINSLEKEICALSGCEFNLDSPKQLQKVLFENLKLAETVDKKELKKLPSGGYSTNAEELEKLKKSHPIIKPVIQYRELSKLKNTYLDALPKLAKEKTGRIHTSFNQAITSTGRLSSNNPNLQNIPIRGEYGKKIRQAFVAEKGKMIIAADYSQIELRIIAHIADDKEMKKAFLEGSDIHSETAAKVYGVDIKKVTPTMRSNAKAVNFGVIYGVSAHGLARQSQLDYRQAKEFIEKYFTAHPGIARYLKEVVNDARRDGYTQTLFGRRRYLPELKSSNFAVRGAAERMAMNMPIQGTAADLIKLAMIEIDHDLKKTSPETKMILTVHDELVFEAPKEKTQEAVKFIREKMETIVKLDIPIRTEIGVAKNWGDAK